MSVLSQYSDSNGVVRLPNEQFELSEIVRDSIKITSQNPRKPAIIVNKDLDKPCLTLFGEDSDVSGVAFYGEGKALSMRGKNQSVRKNNFYNNKTAILSEFKILIEQNHITHFKQDAIRFCSDHSIITKNVIGLLNPAYWDGAHKDCAQGYAGELGTPLRHANRYSGEHSLVGVVFTDNTLFDYPGSPLQGLFIADGRAKGWFVHGNKIMLYSQHGITIRGADCCNVFGNTMMGTAKVNLLPARALVESPDQNDEQKQEWNDIEDNYSCGLGKCEIEVLDIHRGVAINEL